MPPKKRGKKGKKGKGKKKKKEPKHDAGWQKALNNGKWERPFEALPDPFIWPAFSELREKLLATCHLIRFLWSNFMHDDFIDELFRVPRANLVTLGLRGTKYLSKFVMSPSSVAPVLQTLDLSCCPNLEYVLIECGSLECLSFIRCVSLKKLLLQTRKLKQLELKETGQLDCLMLWSDDVEELTFYCNEMAQLELYCPKLVNIVQRPEIKVQKLYPINASVLDIMRADNTSSKVKAYSPVPAMKFRPYVTGPILPRSVSLRM